MASMIQLTRSAPHRLTAFVFVALINLYLWLPESAHAVLQQAAGSGDKRKETEVQQFITYAQNLTAYGALVAAPFAGLAAVRVGFGLYTGRPGAAAEGGQLAIGVAVVIFANVIAN